ncbi:MAG: hypothetical protein MUE71_08040 [Chitinophagaceae bacterium]|jgi:hypothetical protein|nr:hypothetical protein [Chitinophagaceae bacterium]MCU0404366.1 hypothetical protein [Chitinophagaceae bacterium]
MTKLLITDTGPILTLVAIEKFWVLEKLYPQYYLPPAVFSELSSHLPLFKDEHDFFLKELETRVLTIQNDWISGMDLPDTLDSGEIECIILAKQLDDAFFLVEDAFAKKIAIQFDIPSFGTISLLQQAKIKGLIFELRTSFAKILGAKRHYSIRLLNEVLSNNNEPLLDLP